MGDSLDHSFVYFLLDFFCGRMRANQLGSRNCGGSQVTFEAILKRKQVVCMRSKMLFTLLRCLFLFQRSSIIYKIHFEITVL